MKKSDFFLSKNQMGWYSNFEYEIILSENYSYNTEEVDEKINEILQEKRIDLGVDVASPRLHLLVITSYVKRGDYVLLEMTEAVLKNFFGARLRKIKSKLIPEDGYAHSQLFC